MTNGIHAAERLEVNKSFKRSKSAPGLLNPFSMFSGLISCHMETKECVVVAETIGNLHAILAKQREKRAWYR